MAEGIQDEVDEHERESSEGEASAADADTDNEVDPSIDKPSTAVAEDADALHPDQVSPLEDGGTASVMLRSSNLMETYANAIQHLQEVGAVVAASQLDCCMAKERRRQRQMQQENPAVAEAFLRQRELQALEEKKKLQMVQDANNTRRAIADAQRQLKDANAALKKRKAELLDAEKMLDAQHSIKNFSLESLGHGKARGGGQACRKNRFQVLDRFSRLGTGLTAAQRNDWAWFKEAWDDAMSTEHDEIWGSMFASWLQTVLNELQDGIHNAFSTFMYKETRRCLSQIPMLSVPG